ncbi:MAG: YbaN family protein [candidate division KSB1 bacterium]|nr:YbaN family protein [candidate division KSB1 bacterium]
MKYSLRNILLVSAGLISFVLGAVGVVLPLLPTTPFLLLSAACFIRSSDRLYSWLIGHRYFGEYIRRYREHRAVTRRNKIVSISLLWIVISISAFTAVQSWWLRGLLFVIATGVTVHILSLNTWKDDDQ